MAGFWINWMPLGVQAAAGVCVAGGIAWFAGLLDRSLVDSMEARVRWACNDQGQLAGLKRLLDGGVLDKLDAAGVERVLMAALAAIAPYPVNRSGYPINRSGSSMDPLKAILDAGALDKLGHDATERVLGVWLKEHSHVELGPDASRWTFESLVNRLNYPSLPRKAVEALRLARAADAEDADGVLHLHALNRRKSMLLLSTDNLMTELLQAGALHGLSAPDVHILLRDALGGDTRLAHRWAILKDDLLAQARAVMTHAGILQIAVDLCNEQATRELAAQGTLDPHNVKCFRDLLKTNYPRKEELAKVWLIACGERPTGTRAALRTAVLLAGRGVPLRISWAAVTALASNLEPEDQADVTDLILNLKKGVASRWGISEQQWVNIDAWKTTVRGAQRNKRQHEDAPGTNPASRVKKARHAREIDKVTLEGSELRVDGPREYWEYDDEW